MNVQMLLQNVESHRWSEEKEHTQKYMENTFVFTLTDKMPI
eukprot:GDKH01010940.1.p1 GENE.GDKH01010940.1~~GDKH01010940.1.p1  ORF type:complete len:50 (+),score=2.50 GDKH01010940.1:30-152(+)